MGVTVLPEGPVLANRPDLFEAIVKRLASYGKEGWFVDESEHDWKDNPLLEMAKFGHRELLRVTAAAGYTAEA